VSGSTRTLLLPASAASLRPIPWATDMTTGALIPLGALKAWHHHLTVEAHRSPATNRLYRFVFFDFTGFIAGLTKRDRLAGYRLPPEPTPVGCGSTPTSSAGCSSSSKTTSASTRCADWRSGSCYAAARSPAPASMTSSLITARTDADPRRGRPRRMAAPQPGRRRGPARLGRVPAPTGSTSCSAAR
jgi:hypothetical protein